MSRSKVYISWRQIDECLQLTIQDIPDKHLTPPTTIYGVLRGGVIPASLIHRAYPNSTLHTLHPAQLVTSQPELGSDVWIIDDVYDSGATLNELHEAYPNCTYLTLWSKHGKTPEWVHYTFWSDPNTWLVFPWERFDESRTA